MAVITPQAVNSAGATPTYAAASASDTVDVSALNDRVWLQVKNAGGTQDVVTIVDAGVSPAGNSGVDPTVTVPITTGDKVVRLRSDLAASGVITIQHSFTTSVTQAVFYVASP